MDDENVTYMSRPDVEEMVSIFRAGVEELQNIQSEMQAIANTLEGGALLGHGGEIFVNTIRTKLCPAISRLEQKFGEEATDVENAIRTILEGDQSAASRFA